MAFGGDLFPRTHGTLFEVEQCLRIGWCWCEHRMRCGGRTPFETIQHGHHTLQCDAVTGQDYRQLLQVLLQDRPTAQLAAFSSSRTTCGLLLLLLEIDRTEVSGAANR